MNETPPSLLKIWHEVTEELLDRSQQPNSGVPALSPTQRAYLKLSRPVALVDGYAVISTPHSLAKVFIERDLGKFLTMILSERLGRPYTLAVSIVPLDDDDSPSTHTSGEGQTLTQPTGADINSDNDKTPEDAGWKSTHSPVSYSHAVERKDTSFEPPRVVSQQPKTEAASAPPQLRLPRETPAHNPNRDVSLNPKYTFETFVIGPFNRFANAAAVAVAESPAKAFNPLFISGGSGLGKTHLLHAIGNYASQLQPGLKIKYVSSEEFTNDYINSVRDDRQESFKRRYRNLDILMVDDIQFLAGKEGTQEEFFHTFNALHQAQKQIILSSDRPPRQLTTLEDRLRTRFEGGLITDIQPPDLETRIAILMKKAAADGNQVDREVLELIASRFESSIRELEGALIRVSAYASLINQPIDKEMAIIALRDILPKPEDAEITAPLIMEVTADYFDISLATLRGAGKTRAVAHARQLAMYLCRELTEMSLPKIGDAFGGKDHTTVMYADRKIRKEMTQKRDTYDEIQHLTQQIKLRARS